MALMRKKEEREEPNATYILAVRLRKYDREQIEILAEKEGRSMSSWARQVIRERIKNEN